MMSTITITIPTVEVKNPTPLANPPISTNGTGRVGVGLPNMVNNGNVPATLEWSVTNVQNGTFDKVIIDSGGQTEGGATGSKEIGAGNPVNITFFFNVVQGGPGVVNPDCTADYTVQWV